MSTERVADAAAGASGVLFGVSLVSVNLIVQIVAALFAIAAGCMSIWYYWRKIRDGQKRMEWEASDREARRGQDK